MSEMRFEAALHEGDIMRKMKIFEYSRDSNSGWSTAAKPTGGFGNEAGGLWMGSALSLSLLVTSGFDDFDWDVMGYNNLFSDGSADHLDLQ